MLVTKHGAHACKPPLTIEPEHANTFAQGANTSAFPIVHIKIFCMIPTVMPKLLRPAVRQLSVHGTPLSRLRPKHWLQQYIICLPTWLTFSASPPTCQSPLPQVLLILAPKGLCPLAPDPSPSPYFALRAQLRAQTEYWSHPIRISLSDLLPVVLLSCLTSAFSHCCLLFPLLPIALCIPCSCLAHPYAFAGMRAAALLSYNFWLLLVIHQLLLLSPQNQLQQSHFRQQDFLDEQFQYLLCPNIACSLLSGIACSVDVLSVSLSAARPGGIEGQNGQGIKGCANSIARRVEWSY